MKEWKREGEGVEKKRKRKRKGSGEVRKGTWTLRSCKGYYLHKCMCVCLHIMVYIDLYKTVYRYFSEIFLNLQVRTADGSWGPRRQPRVPSWDVLNSVFLQSDGQHWSKPIGRLEVSNPQDGVDPELLVREIKVDNICQKSKIFS